MIWNEPHSTAVPLATRLTSEITAVCQDTRMLDAAGIEELAKAVEAYVQTEPGEAGAESRYVVLLASKALASLGDDANARRLLVFGTGLVRPVEWEVTGGDSLWVLDLKNITVRDGFLEMALFNSLSLVLDSVAEVWDEFSGRGTLGLRHVTATASALLGQTEKNKKTRRLAEEIKDVCVQKLGQLSEKRGWVRSPTVMDLD